MFYVIVNGCDYGKNGYIGVLDNLCEMFDNKEEAIKYAERRLAKETGFGAVWDYSIDKKVWYGVKL